MLENELKINYVPEENSEEFTVTRLSTLIKMAIERNFRDIKLKAEVSALKEQHSSGHLYFTLKDADSIIDAVCWKSIAQKKKIKLKDGMEIRCVGHVTTYSMRSKYQFVVKQFELAGIGELLKLLEERKKKLAKEGLFDLSRKKSLPRLPKLIGVITSPTGAAIQDILHRIRQRFPQNILLWPVLVQGAEADEQIIKAIDGMNALTDGARPNVLIVARGGGSLEDLMPFNEEGVVRAVARSEIPVISAVGHETDIPLIDFAADLRVPTPTAAAEHVAQEKVKLKADIDKFFSRLCMVILSSLKIKKSFLYSNKILNIQGIISERIQRVDFALDKIMSEIKNSIAKKRASVEKIILHKPVAGENLDKIWQRLSFVFCRMFDGYKNDFRIVSNAIEANSYTRILNKGFAFVESEKSVPITSAQEAVKHSIFNLTFSDGKLRISAFQGDSF